MLLLLTKITKFQLIKEFQSLVERIKNSEVTDKEKDIEKDKDITKAKLEKISEKKDINDEKY